MIKEESQYIKHKSNHHLMKDGALSAESDLCNIRTAGGNDSSARWSHPNMLEPVTKVLKNSIIMVIHRRLKIPGSRLYCTQNWH